MDFQKQTKLNLLDHFYEYLDEDDWIEGVELYQAGRVNQIETYHGLISSKISEGPRKCDVRLKIHPSGHCIQWIECTCTKNRKYGAYCEHIAALMLHVDRERSELFSKLDSTAPLKPPNMLKRGTASQKKSKDQTDKDEKVDVGATQSMLQHLQGSIHSISLLAKGPTLRVRVEIKEGKLTHYDLPIDQAAKFLANHTNHPSSSIEVRGLKVFDLPVEIGTHIVEEGSENLKTEKVVAVKLYKKPTAKQLEKFNFKFLIDKFTRITTDQVETDASLYMLVPYKVASKHIGKEFFFLPTQGYWPINRGALKEEWFELPLTKTFKEDAAAKFVNESFGEFRNSGPVFLPPKLVKSTDLETPKLSQIKVIKQQGGWFHLDPRYGDGKASVSMVQLMKQHRKLQRKYLKSGDKWVKIPEFITEHDWQLDESGETIKVDALGLMRLKAALGDFDQFVGSKHALNKIRNNLEFSEEQTPPDLSHTKLNLREYQTTGLKWFWWLYENHLHGLLADEMGLGKTHQAMAALSAIQKKEKSCNFLIVCPTSVLDHWLDKMKDFAPNLSPTKFHGAKRGHLLESKKPGTRTFITSYGVLLRDINNLIDLEWSGIVLDEAHLIKNNNTATYKAACRLNARIRIALTGTPLENHLGELKNLFDFLVPGYLGSDQYFKKNFISSIKQNDDSETEIALQKLIHPFKLRRTKDQVLKDLPEKVEDIRHCTMSNAQIKMYREVIDMKARPLVDKLTANEEPVPYLHVFATLTLLKQICNHPALLQKNATFDQFESGKFELLKELLEEALGSGHKIVIYSQYVQMIELIKGYLNSINVNHVALTGRTRKRGEVIKKFQEDPDTKVFIGSLLAGGVGIDLTAASVVIHYDRWWNASKENQATDRVHRIGQNKNVQVLKLVTRGTLEEKIDALIEKKKALFEKFMDRDEELFKNLSRKELIELLQ